MLRVWFPALLRVPDARIDRNPVGLPVAATVVRIGLFEACRVGRDVGNDKADEDGFAVEVFLAVELAAAVAEAAMDRTGQGAAARAGVVQAPLPGLRVVQAQAHTLDRSRRARHPQFDQIGAPVQHFPHDAGAGVFHPFLRTGQGLGQPPQFGLPGADFPIEIVLAVARDRGDRRRLCRRVHRQQCHGQAGAAEPASRGVLHRLVPSPMMRAG